MTDFIFIVTGLVTFAIATFFVIPFILLLPERKFKYPKEWTKRDEEFARKMEARRWR